MLNRDKEHTAMLNAIRATCDGYSKGIVLIDGTAVWLYAHQYVEDINMTQISYDAAMYVSVENFSTLRTFEVITPNKRLGKHYLWKKGFDFYIYVERQSSLIVPFEAVSASAHCIDGMQCASLGHLLTLKTHAYAERKMSDKGTKDAADIAKILMPLALDHANGTDNEKLTYDMAFLLDEETPLLDRVVNSNDIFYAMSGKNSHVAKSYKQTASQGLHHVKKALNTYMDTSPDSDTWDGTDRRAGPKITS